MTRNFKTLGLALVVVLALSAVAASAALAQANGELTSDGPVTLIGVQTGGVGDNALTAFGFGVTRCGSAFYTGHTYNATPHELVSGGPEAITITPHYGACTTQNLPSTIDMNGCDYVIHLEGTNGVAKYSVKTTILCPEKQHITITQFSSHANHTAGKPFCHTTITENVLGYSGLSATDTANGRIDITGTITGIHADRKSPTGSILCPEATEANGELHLDIEVRGTQGGPTGKATDISLSH